MSFSEWAEQLNCAGSAPSVSLSKFFHDAYDKGVITAVEEHPKEAALTAVVAMTAGAAAIYLGRGRALALAGILSHGGEEVTGIDALLTRGVPLTTDTRALVASDLVVRTTPWNRSAAIRATAGYLEEGTGSGGKLIFGTFEKAGYEHISVRTTSGPGIDAITHSLPTTTANPSQIASIRAAAARDMSPGAKSMFGKFDDANYRHVPFRKIDPTPTVIQGGHLRHTRFDGF